MKRQKLSIIIVLTMMISLFNIISVESSGYNDTAGHWAEAAVERLSDEEIILGYNGCFSPDSRIIRADAAVIMSRLLSLSAGSDGNFSDVSENDYYSAAVNSVNEAGIMQGKGRGIFAPKDSLTRQETAVLISNALYLESADTFTTGFSDEGDIADWAKDSILKCVYNGIFSGYPDGSIRPQAYITRAEFVTILDNAFSDFVKEGASKNIFGRALAKSNARFENSYVVGDIFDACTKITFENGSVSGRVITLNGGSIILSGESLIESIIAAGGGGTLKIETSDESLVQLLVIRSEANITLSGNFGTVEIYENTELNLTGASVKNVVTKTAAQINVDANSYIETVTANGEQTALQGVGAVGNAYINQNNCTVTTSNTSVTVAGGVSGTIVGQEKVDGGKTVISPDNTTSMGGSSGYTETVVSTEIDRDALGTNNGSQTEDAEEPITVYLAVDSFVLGNNIEDFIVKPVKVSSTNKTNAAQMLVKQIGGMISYTGSTDGGFYVNKLDAGEWFAPEQIEYALLTDCFKNAVSAGTVKPKFDTAFFSQMQKNNEYGWLGEFDYTSMSGWMYSVNNKYPNVAMSDYLLSDGDVVRLTFTLWGWGADVGGGYATGGTGYTDYYEIADLTEMIRASAEVRNSDSELYGELLDAAVRVGVQ